MKIWKLSYAILALFIALLGLTFVEKPDSRLHLIACDVGQGDATLVIHGEIQILIDGGPDSKVLDCLGRYAPYNDREIELVILTHPQIDHFGGLIEVFRRYKVNDFLVSGLDSGTEAYQVLKKEVGGQGVRVINPDTGLSLRLGKIYIDILHPSQQFVLTNSIKTGTGNSQAIMGAYTSKKDSNDFSIVARLSVDSFSILLTGDISPGSEAFLLSEGLIQPADYIKIPHHGSKNGLTQTFLDAVEPKVALISVGKDNRYGHPNREILDMLKAKGVQILRTDEVGDIEIIPAIKQ